jgi:hypothetical protein
MRTNGANEEGETTIKTMGDDEERLMTLIREGGGGEHV